MVVKLRMISAGVCFTSPCLVSSDWTLSGHPNPANDGHLKTGQRESGWDVDSGVRQGSLRRHEQRLERGKKTTSHCPGTAGMVGAANPATDRGASRNRGCLPEVGGDPGAATWWMGTAIAGKSGQRG